VVKSEISGRGTTRAEWSISSLSKGMREAFRCAFGFLYKMVLRAIAYGPDGKVLSAIGVRSIVVFLGGKGSWLRVN